MIAEANDLLAGAARPAAPTQRRDRAWRVVRF
jgi:hypothetical protein